MTLDERIADLLKQATTERSHNYVAATLRLIQIELERLRYIEKFYIG